MKTIKETHGTLGDGAGKKRRAAISPELSADLIMALDFANSCFVKLRSGSMITREDELQFAGLIADIEKKHHITFGR